jgi:hypothetical protein
MRLVLLILVLSLSGILWWGISELMARPRPADPAYQARLEAPCTKCGNHNVRPRYCKERCESPSPTLDPQKRGSPVVWGHEHIHRACGSCGFSGDILECLDKEQP